MIQIPSFRIAACDAWLQIGGDEAVQYLANRFRSDEDVDVRLHAIRDLRCSR